MTQNAKPDQQKPEHGSIGMLILGLVAVCAGGIGIIIVVLLRIVLGAVIGSFVLHGVLSTITGIFTHRFF
jgi:hypothetical protein